MEWWGWVFAVLWIIDEVLSRFAKIPANSIGDVVLSFVRFIIRKQ